MPVNKWVVKQLQFTDV